MSKVQSEALLGMSRASISVGSKRCLEQGSTSGSSRAEWGRRGPTLLSLVPSEESRQPVSQSVSQVTSPDSGDFPSAWNNPDP